MEKLGPQKSEEPVLTQKQRQTLKSSSLGERDDCLPYHVSSGVVLGGVMIPRRGLVA